MFNFSNDSPKLQIKAVYQSSHYQHYSQIVPRRERSSRDPKTPGKMIGLIVKYNFFYNKNMGFFRFS